MRRTVTRAAVKHRDFAVFGPRLNKPPQNNYSQSSTPEAAAAAAAAALSLVLQLLLVLGAGCWLVLVLVAGAGCWCCLCLQRGNSGNGGRRYRAGTDNAVRLLHLLLLLATAAVVLDTLRCRLQNL